MLQGIGVEVREIRLPEDLVEVDGLIIPGGESTAIGKLMTRWNLIEPIKEMVSQGKPVWGTCAGMILLAKDIGGLDQPLLGLMDIKVKRNAFGSQLDSFETDLEIKGLGKPQFHAVFIRAPFIETVDESKGVEILATLPDNRAAGLDESNTAIVVARQGNLLATAFHPELTNDPRFHQLFLSMVE
ncbi:pyridoxal 5'-phosphate synthase glutaminase subunit PdxT [Candidatus Chlorohelix allophototropha]|nr:pyridoxal 5'-phosphate synthase glutaminase subunit PdxT [Chloroflexota bacterium L227-S17]